MASEASDTVTVLYQAFDKLKAAGDAAGENAAEYNRIISAVKGDVKAKTLAAQFIPPFFGKFPNLAEAALNAQLDLVEDENNVIRMHAIIGLAEIAKNSPKHVKQIADVLTQLLVTEDAKELAVVKKAFDNLFPLDSKQVFESVIGQIKDGEDAMRQRNIEFLQTQVEKIKAELHKNEELQNFLATAVKGVLTHENGVTGVEFKLFLDMLRSMPIFRKDQTLAQELAKIITNTSGISKPFEPTNEEAIQQLVSCLNMVQALYSKGASNADFLLFFCHKVAPAGVFEKISDKNRLLLLRAIADLSSFSNEATARAALGPIHDLLKRYLPTNANDIGPLSSAEKKAEAPAAPAGDAKTEDASAEKKKPAPIAPVSAAAAAAGPKINFSAVEALLYIFHQLCTAAPAAARDVSGLFTPTGQPGDFRADLKTKREEIVVRLEFLKNSLTAYQQTIKNVEAKIAEKMKESKEEEEKKTLATKKKTVGDALRTASNVSSMTTALLGKSPTFLGRGAVNCSWRTGRRGPGFKRNKSAGPAGAPGAKRQKNQAGGVAGRGGAGGQRGRGGKRKAGGDGSVGASKRQRQGNNNNNNGGGGGGRARSRSGGRGGRGGRGRGRGRG